METTITQRIKIIMDEKGLNVNSFSKLINVTQSTLATMYKRNTSPSYILLMRIINVSPDINLNWLILGEGEMKKESSLFAIPSKDSININVKSKEMEMAEDYINLLKKTLKERDEKIAELELKKGGVTDAVVVPKDLSA